ncbi:MAG TPA: hypothetical protein VNL92_03125 [Dehalococcoidia bacterium]|nr:hypothetical protein [Dehalococcoidia bacterium]
MVDERDRRVPTTDTQRAIAATGVRHLDLAEARIQVHRALGRALPGRERDWADHVAGTLELLRTALADHKGDALGAKGLYEQIRFDEPRLTRRVDELEAELLRIEGVAAQLHERAQRISQGERAGIETMRDDTEALLKAIRDLLAAEADLVWEQYNEPIALD